MSEKKTSKPSTLANFSTAGLSGIIGWIVVHPFNTVAIRMNLAASSGTASKASFPSQFMNIVNKEGVRSLYAGLPSGILRQLFYATSRFGLFEVFRDEMAKYRPTDIWSRLITGSVAGGIAALISCPAEVTLVRISNDSSLPAESRRNYSGKNPQIRTHSVISGMCYSFYIVNAGLVNTFTRILKEEGVKTFFSGSGPFVNRALLVGAVQVGTYDQFRDMYATKFNIKSEFSNVFSAAMTSGLLYSLITMPFETAKNRMAFQKPDALTGIKPYRSTFQSISKIASAEGVLGLWAGFSPYYLRCGGHTVAMFAAMAWLRKYIN
jgi:solute carrier family 25 oxoglutarate transporter 11